MSTLDLGQLANRLLPAVMSAAAIEMAYFRAGVMVEQKSDQSPVTAADREAEAILISALNRIMPDVPVVAEEQMARGEGPNQLGDLFFLVDPLDGTRQFVDGNPEFTINIGLIQNTRPVFGLIYAPALERFFVTLDEHQAVAGTVSVSKPPQTWSDTGMKPIEARPRPSDGLLVLTRRSKQAGAAVAEFLEGLPVVGTRTMGSSVKFALIAAGEADLYPRLGPTSEWDTAAGHAILNAAGGRVEQIAGGPLTYGHSERNFINPHFVARGQ
jgi:3'(2'), 5'-bisphosphate nucleotidase